MSMALQEMFPKQKLHATQLFLLFSFIIFFNFQKNHALFFERKFPFYWPFFGKKCLLKKNVPIKWYA